MLAPGFVRFSCHALGKVPSLYQSQLPQKVLMGCLRFRLGSHHLHVNTGRWCVPSTPRAERACRQCNQHLAVDDETHCVLHCTHPSLVAGRARLFAALAASDGLHPGQPIHTFQHFCTLWGRARSCAQARSSFIALCSRVAWRCYNHGGSDVPVQIPAWWSSLPEYLNDSCEVPL